MKGRFAILRYGFRFPSIGDYDDIWITCCALHNFLLSIGGLSNEWQSGVRSDWEIINDQSMHPNYNLMVDVPFVITRVN